MRAIIIIGKAGLKDSVVKEIKRQLKDKKLIKVKFLKSAIEGKDKKQLFNELAEKTGSEIVYNIGFAVALHRK